MPDATVRLGYDDKDVASGLNRTAGHVRRFESQTRGLFSGIGSGLGGALGLLGAGAGLAGMKSLADQFDRIGDLAKQLDQSAESVQRLGAMAKLSGADMEAVARAHNKLNRVVAEGGASAAFKELGINLQAYLALDADQQMIMLAKAFQTAESSGRGLAEAYDLFGRNAQELLPLLRGNVAELEKASQIKVISDEQMADLQQFNDDFDRLVMSAKAGVASLALDMKKNFADFYEGFGNWLESFDRVPGGIGSISSNVADAQAESTDDAQTASDIAAEEREARKEAAGRADAEAAIKKELEDQLKECEALERHHAEIAKIEEREAEQAKRKAADAKKEADAKNKERDARLESIRDLELEMQILELRARGHDKQADALERENRIKKDAHAIAKATGMAESQALEVARRKADLEDKANRTARSDGRHRIHGYSHAQRATNPYLHRSGLDEHYANQRGNFFDRHPTGMSPRPHHKKRERTEDKANQTLEQKLDTIIENTAPLKTK